MIGLGWDELAAEEWLEKIFNDQSSDDQNSNDKQPD